MVRKWTAIAVAVKSIESVENKSMELLLSGRNLWIVDKKPQALINIDCSGGELRIGAECFKVNDVYAALFCKELRNITFVIQNDKVHQMSLVLETAELFEKVFQYLKDNCPNLEFSEQGKKINGYASSLVEKLEEGITVTIIETKDVKEIFCPECGMQCDPNIPYCLECGAAV